MGRSTQSCQRIRLQSHSFYSCSSELLHCLTPKLSIGVLTFRIMDLLQELGGSLSCYSLRDQLRFNPMFYDEGREYSMEDVAKLVKKMRNEWKVILTSIMQWNIVLKTISF